MEKIGHFDIKKYIRGDQILESWKNMSLPEQLGNIGSEYERALSWREKREKDHFRNAFLRLIELFDLTLSDSRWSKNRFREIYWAKRVAIAELYNLKPLASNPESLKRYFLQFAILARSKT